MFQITDNHSQQAVIKVIGVGGGGGNAVEHMITEKVDGVEFAVLNTDLQVLKKIVNAHCIPIGEDVTKGLGAGANPDIGRKAAEESLEKVREYLEGTDMVFFTAGMGGGTGTGATPILAKLAKEMGILTVAVVTKPFSFEGKSRSNIAQEGIDALAQHVDSLIIVPNNKLLSVLGKNMSLLNAFKATNNILYGAVSGISELITRPGLINVDFADVRTVMSEMGTAMMGTGVASGENRAKEAAQAAIHSPLLEDIRLMGAKGVLVNITAGLNLSIGEFEEVGEAVRAFTADIATVVVGTVIDPNMGDDMRVTVVATGLEENEESTAPSTQATAPQAESATIRPDGSVDYQKLQRPAILRQARTTAPQAQSGTAPTEASDLTAKETDLDYLDIPAFLRRQEEYVD